MLSTQMSRELRRCQELLIGRRDPEALNEFWKAASYEEIARARRTGVAAPRVSSSILEASRVAESERDQNVMRYGEMLLHAGHPAAGIDFIQAGLQSDRIGVPGRIIGRRLEAMAKWMLGERKLTVLETLRESRTDARDLGFAHQSRLLAASMARVRQGVRSLRPD